MVRSSRRHRGELTRRSDLKTLDLNEEEDLFLETSSVMADYDTPGEGVDPKLDTATTESDIDLDVAIEIQDDSQGQSPIDDVSVLQVGEAGNESVHASEGHEIHTTEDYLINDVSGQDVSMPGSVLAADIDKELLVLSEHGLIAGTSGIEGSIFCRWGS
jgi:hypothetical protein